MTLSDKLPPQLNAILRALRSHYPCAVPSEVLWERLHWIKPKTLKAQMWRLRRRIAPEWRIVGVRGSGRSYRLEKTPMSHSKPLVIDIYHGNIVNDFAATKASGIIGVIHKCGTGISGIDPRYHQRQRLAIGDDLLWGAYHWLDPRQDGARQADHMLSIVGLDDTVLYAVDWERTVGVGDPSAHVCRAFLERIEEKTGRKAVIYSGNVAKEQIKGKDEYFGAHRLWLAQYSTVWRVQPSWNYPWLWQNNGDASGGGPHRIPGLPELCDNSCVVPPMDIGRLVMEWAGVPKIS